MTSSWEAGFEPSHAHGEADDDGPRAVPRAVATYRATVSVALERSEFALDAAAGVERARAASAAAPGWIAQWPPPELNVSDVRESTTEGLALAKLVALFDFNSEIEESNPDGIRRAIDARWPDVARARDERAQRGQVYERVEVTAWLREDGTADWSYTRGEGAGERLPSFASGESLARGDLEVFVQNVVRADLRERMLSAAVA